jgi:hypothetical protein
VKVLAVLQNPGYLRHYGSVLVELARRGHHVRVAFSDERRMREGLLSLEEAPEQIEAVTDVPKRKDVWAPFALMLRRLTAYARYLDPRLEARYVRDRLDRLPWALGFLRRLESLPLGVLAPLLRGLVGIERILPPNRDHERWLAEQRPDVVFVSPVVQDLGQADVFKAAARLGIPTALGIASWDHLTTKGLVSIRPDRVLVWNETQREELETLHMLDGDRVVVTGSQSFDPWFGREPSTDRETFCGRLGLPADRPYVLYVGSFRSIADARGEQEFIEGWLEALRAHPRLANVSVLVRPHPYNSEGWDESGLEAPGQVAVWAHAAYPVHEDARRAYFDSLYHSVAVVGINTSAMIEAAIVGRPVLTIETPRFADTQAATIHFRYLKSESGGFLQTARSYEEHFRQLDAVVNEAPFDPGCVEPFIRSFVRPRGLDRDCVPIVADAIEEAGGIRPAPARASLLRFALLPLALLVWALDPKVKKRARRSAARRARKLGRIVKWALQRAFLRPAASALRMAGLRDRPELEAARPERPSD